jgi:hypothetical protein
MIYHYICIWWWYNLLVNVTLELEAPEPIYECGGGREWEGPRRQWRRSMRIRWQSARRWRGPDGVVSRQWCGCDSGGGAGM